MVQIALTTREVEMIKLLLKVGDYVTCPIDTSYESYKTKPPAKKLRVTQKSTHFFIAKDSNGKDHCIQYKMLAINQLNDSNTPNEYLKNLARKNNATLIGNELYVDGTQAVKMVSELPIKPTRKVMSMVRRDKSVRTKSNGDGRSRRYFYHLGDLKKFISRQKERLI